MSPARPLRSAGVLAGSLTESEASRRVYLAAGGLALLGLLLLVGTVWWWRTTRNEHPALAPLEVMGARRWRRAGDPERQRLVDGVRPEGAEVGAPVVEPEPVDLAALAVGDHAGFDDLRELDELLGLDVDQLLARRAAAEAAAAEAAAEAVAAGETADAGVEAGPAGSDGLEGGAAAPDDDVAAAGADVQDDVAPGVDETIALVPDEEPGAMSPARVDDVQGEDGKAVEAAASSGDDEGATAEGPGDLGDAPDVDDDSGPAAAPQDPLLQRSLDG